MRDPITIIIIEFLGLKYCVSSFTMFITELLQIVTGTIRGLSILVKMGLMVIGLPGYGFVEEEGEVLPVAAYVVTLSVDFCFVT